MLVVLGAELGDDALAVGRRDRMEIRPRVGPGVLREDGIAAASAKDREGAGALVLPDDQPRRSGARLFRLAVQRRPRRESGADGGEDDQVPSVRRVLEFCMCDAPIGDLHQSISHDDRDSLTMADDGARRKLLESAFFVTSS